MRSILFFVLLVPVIFVSAFKTGPVVKHKYQVTTSLKSQPVGIDTNVVVWFEGKPLRYYQYLPYLKTGRYTITNYIDLKDGKLEGRKDLVTIDDRLEKKLPMDAQSITKRIDALFFTPKAIPLSKLDTNIIVNHNGRSLRYYQYLPILLTGNYSVRMDSGKRTTEKLSGMALSFLSRDSATINNAIFTWLSKADKIIVEKAKRRLYIERNGKRLFDFPINLGKSPVGHKLKEGDGRTPEGLYYLDYNVNVEASYHLGFHISYPNADDIARAKKQGVKPGGDVMIHGTSPARSKLKDWTNGCIAIANNHLDTIMKYQYRTIPIEIRK